MIVLDVYRCSGYVSRSVLAAELIETVLEEEMPEAEEVFAAEHGGDFILPEASEWLT